MKYHIPISLFTHYTRKLEKESTYPSTLNKKGEEETYLSSHDDDNGMLDDESKKKFRSVGCSVGVSFRVWVFEKKKERNNNEREEEKEP